jgi:hypothetical protein
MLSLGINSFVTRQTAESRFSHFEGTWDELVNLVTENFDKAKPGYKDGVVLVPVSPDRFKSGVVEVTAETVLKTTFAARSEGEDAYLQTVAIGAPKTQAKFVEVAVYSHATLLERNEQSTDKDWEIVTILARASEGEEPMNPMTMARNMLGLTGGTSATYTAEQFAQAIVYWSKRCMSGGSQ